MYRAPWAETPLPMVSTFGPWGVAPSPAVTGSASTPGAATWESSNRAVYMPVIVPCVCVVRRVWWMNGATTGSATIEVGIYNQSAYGPGSKIISGSATQGNASEVQFVDVTDTTLAPGVYWLAIMASTTTNTTLFRLAVNTSQDGTRRMQQASANPLPSTATPVESTAANVWVCGFSTTTIT